MRSIREIISEHGQITSKYPKTKGHLLWGDNTIISHEQYEDLASAIRAELNEMIEGKKDIVPSYSKGTDGYELKLLQLGYNQALSDIQKEIECLLK